MRFVVLYDTKNLNIKTPRHDNRVYTYKMECASVLETLVDATSTMIYDRCTYLKGSTRSKCSNGLHFSRWKISSKRVSASMRCCLASSNEKVSFAGTNTGGVGLRGIDLTSVAAAGAGSDSMVSSVRDFFRVVVFALEPAVLRFVDRDFCGTSGTGVAGSSVMCTSATAAAARLTERVIRIVRAVLSNVTRKRRSRRCLVEMNIPTKVGSVAK